MKKLYILILLSLTTTSFFAQIGINTTDPKALLEIKSSSETAPTITDGLLIPKVNVFPATNPTIDQQGMLVYLKNPVGSNLPGFYYWNFGTLAWIPVGNNNSSGWNINGNAGTNSAANFIGTTDSQDVVFKRNNVKAGLLAPNNTGFGVSALNSLTTGVLNTAIGNLALFSNTSGLFNTATGQGALASNTTANFNTANGVSSLALNTTGSNNTAIGYESLSSNTFGSQNTASGALALENNTTGSLNTANGFSALQNNTTGFRNTANGSFSLASNTTGRENTAIGHLTLFSNTTGNGNIANGFSALYSNTIGNSNTANGNFTLQFNTTGNSNTANGVSSLASNTTGNSNTANGQESLNRNTTGGFNTANGTSALFFNTTGTSNAANGSLALQSNITGSFNSSLGVLSDVALDNLTNATAIGARAVVGTSNSLVLGSINGVNGATASVNVGIGTSTPLDELHVVGNIRMVDGNQAAGKVLTSDVNGTSTWTNPIGITNGTLDQSYDFGGAGLGKTITADAGAVLINGNDGLVSTGTAGSGALAPTGSGTKMFWNPRKAAFRAGEAAGTSWDDANVGQNSVAMGFGTIASGNSSIALGSGSVALGLGSVAFGWSARADATQSTAFGLSTNANAIYSTAFGYDTTTSGQASTSFGVNNEAKSFGEVVLGIGATTYSPSTNGVSQYRTANATDRLLVVGNAIDVDNDGTVDTSERSDALIILKNGLTRLSSTTNAMITAADGKAVVTKEFLQSNTSAWGLTGNDATNATTNFIGTTDNIDLIFRRQNNRAGLIGVTNTSFGRFALNSSSTGSQNTANGALALSLNTTGSENTANGYSTLSSNTTGNENTANGFFALGGNTTGSENSSLGYFTNVSSGNLTNATAIGSRAMVGSSNSLVLGSVSGVNGATSSVNVGIGTITPDRKLEVSGPAGLVATRITNTSTTGATSNVALEFFRATNANTDWQIYNIGPFLTIGNSLDDLATVNELYQFQGVRFMPMTDATINLGQSANRWNTLFASNGTINTSDEREKKNIQNINYGLEDLLKLRPVSFEWKKEDGSGKKLGLIAQELQKVIPEVVRDWDWQEDEKGNPSKIPASTLGVYYSDLIPVLIKSIQEQQSIIDTQKIQLEAQAKTITTILNRLSTLENN